MKVEYYGGPIDGFEEHFAEPLLVGMKIAIYHPDFPGLRYEYLGHGKAFFVPFEGAHA